MTKFKDDLVCNIALVIALVLTVTHLTIVSLGLFGAIELSLPLSFSYITAYILVVVCLALFICSMLIVDRKKIMAPNWLRIMFYFAFFVFTNVYYFFGLYENLIWVSIMFGYVGFLAIVCALSIFYNSLKDDKNRLQVSNKFLLFNVLSIALAILFIVSLVVLIVNSLVMPTTLLANPNNYALIMLVMLGVAILVTISFAISLRANKSWVNLCLVKIKTTPKFSKSTKQK